MRIFLVFMFSLFMFGCGVEQDSSNAFAEIERYRVGDDISKRELESLGFKENPNPILEMKGYKRYVITDEAEAVGAFMPAAFVTLNNTIEWAGFLYVDSKNQADKQFDMLKDYIESNWNTSLQLESTHQYATTYYARVEEPTGVELIIVGFGSEDNSTYKLMVTFLMKDIAYEYFL